MIPKVIHYCWFGKNPMPPTIKMCIQSWKKHLPDYTFQLWTEDNYDILHPFAIAAYQSKKWAFVADYARFDILYQNGGIYLDTDMLLLKNLDELLNQNCFVGLENKTTINCAIIGAKQEIPFLKKCLKIYDALPFSETNTPSISQLITALQKSNPSNVQVYPTDFFYPLPFDCRGQNPTSFITKNSFAVHLWEASWLNEWEFFIYGFNKSGFKIVLQKLKKNPIQPLSYYFRLLKAITPKWAKNTIWRFCKFIVRIALPIPYIKNCVIYSKIFPYEIRYYLFPNSEKFDIKSVLRIQRHKINYEVNLGEYNGWRIYFNVFSRGTHSLFKIIEPEFNIVDVGANIGYYTLNFSKKAYRGEIFAFEPFPTNYQKLRQNLSLNTNLSNIKTYPVALGSISSKISMETIIERNMGMVQVSENKDSHSDIEIIPFDYFMKTLKTTIDLIKIDIEGYELHFLKGAKKTITKHFPILFIELSDKNLKKYNSSAIELVDFLEKLGYNDITNADSGNQIYSFLNLEDCFMDILCRKI